MEEAGFLAAQSISEEECTHFVGSSDPSTHVGLYNVIFVCGDTNDICNSAHIIEYLYFYM